MNSDGGKMRDFVEESCRLLAADCDALEHSIQGALGIGPGPDLEEASRLLREITNRGAAVGFSDVSLRAVALQTALQSLFVRQLQPRSGEEAQIREALAQLKSTVAKLKPESSRLYDTNLAKPHGGQGFRRIVTR